MFFEYQKGRREEKRRRRKKMLRICKEEGNKA
jgi:hypothetical protein